MLCFQVVVGEHSNVIQRDFAKVDHVKSARQNGKICGLDCGDVVVVLA